MNLQKLAQLNAENRAARLYFGYFAERNRAFPRTSIQDVIDVARRQDQTVSPSEVEAFFEGLRLANCGQFVAEEAGGRFVWLFRATQVARAARQTPFDAASQSTLAAVAPQPGAPVTHLLRLRADWTLKVELLADFSADEARRIGHFVLSLPIEEPQSAQNTPQRPQ